MRRAPSPTAIADRINLLRLYVLNAARWNPVTVTAGTIRIGAGSLTVYALNIVLCSCSVRRPRR
jgi:hypothetical protein